MLRMLLTQDSSLQACVGWHLAYSRVRIIGTLDNLVAPEVELQARAGAMLIPVLGLQAWLCWGPADVNSTSTVI